MVAAAVLEVQVARWHDVAKSYENEMLPRERTRERGRQSWRKKKKNGDDDETELNFRSLDERDARWAYRKNGTGNTIAISIDKARKVVGPEGH